MRAFCRAAALVLAVILLAVLSIPALADDAQTQIEPLTILFTHDTHDHFLPDAANVGGYTRLATLLKQERAAADGPVVTLDAGDFSMGSFLQTVYATDAPELRALGYMGYDVTTFGNHEYDFRPAGLASMLNVAREAQQAAVDVAQSDDAEALARYMEAYGPLTPELPAIVQSNYHTAKDDYGRVAVEAMENFPVTEYTVLTREGRSRVPGRPLTIAVFGLVGVDSDDCTPMSGMALEPIADAAKRMVDKIRREVNPDYIIALSHSGTEDGKGEDVELAKAVSGIDLIISGHTHATLSEPIVVNGTAIVSCGPYTRNLGKIVLSKTVGSQEKTTVESYQLIPINASVPDDEGMVELVEWFKKLVDKNYLSQYGLEYDEVLATSVNDFSRARTGDLIGEAYISTVREVEGDSYVPIAFAVCPDGVIRDRIRAGQVTTDNAFTILSLGVGADGTPAYPLISLYLTGKDLKNAFEVDASVSQIMSSATLYGAGSHWQYNPNRMFLDRVTHAALATNPRATQTAGAWSKTWDEEKIDDKKLYRVVADLYSGQMLSSVKAKSFGLLSITPRNADGTEIADFEDCIIHDENGSEIKAWYALASYLKKQGTVDAEAVIPSKAAERSWNPVHLLIPMGWPTAALLALALVLILLVVLIVLGIRRLIRRIRRRHAKRK